MNTIQGVLMLSGPQRACRSLPTPGYTAAAPEGRIYAVKLTAAPTYSCSIGRFFGAAAIDMLLLTCLFSNCPASTLLEVD